MGPHSTFGGFLVGSSRFNVFCPHKYLLTILKVGDGVSAGPSGPDPLLCPANVTDVVVGSLSRGRDVLTSMLEASSLSGVPGCWGGRLCWPTMGILCGGHRSMCRHSPRGRSLTQLYCLVVAAS